MRYSSQDKPSSALEDAEPRSQPCRSAGAARGHELAHDVVALRIARQQVVEDAAHRARHPIRRVRRPRASESEGAEGAVSEATFPQAGELGGGGRLVRYQVGEDAAHVAHRVHQRQAVVEGALRRAVGAGVRARAGDAHVVVVGRDGERAAQATARLLQRRARAQRAVEPSPRSHAAHRRVGLPRALRRVATLLFCPRGGSRRELQRVGELTRRS
mmetsp:Transcript_2751/g.5802  ORF Transcript_2751/g.5802 Transcript_2751/m.5802 type:complete len:215 (+) Transcript_2751:409-1053(+)|eukprot:CAMPEP_0195573646 /NCGR_PEP_ID=MMETSP0814-20130614/5467_1 /TAXON_ID=97485 /ORGANISM="Prymnesium parvum, Strain Texoma1" /LENGTH=214 /DNA_ID=CAMNT_0040709549 /DNA_START=322 /DNA_END=966 /DNA_ORIENTATION=-